MGKISNALGPAAAIVLAGVGVTGFILLFVRRLNAFWLVLAPVILAVYLIPAVIVYGLWKKKRAPRPTDDGEAPEQSGEDSGGAPGQTG